MPGDTMSKAPLNPSLTDDQLDQLCINTIRTLSIDAIQQAKSGHPGTPMALAPLVYTLWNRVLRFDPQDPIWPNRDRFVLSNGHASMLLWSVLHLTKTQAVNAEYEILGKPSVTRDDIRHFRQLDSKAPGHPEYHWVSGVETTTGPLGQGVATSVGMAIAEKWLVSHYNRPNFQIFDYDIYAICGDGCLMEGVGSEAASLAGHLRLDNLCWIYDNNHISLEGSTRLTFLVPGGVYERFAEGIGKRGSQARRSWTALFEAYRAKYPDLAKEIDLMQRRELPAGWERNLPVFPADSKGIAGRDASGKVLNVLAQNIPWFLGGSADLAPSNRTTLTFEGAGDLQGDNPGGKNLHFGVREHAMAAIMNGLSLSKLRPFGGTFLIFSDYARPGIRLAAIMELPVIFVFTHDAMGDGEDGPTHQPVEQLASLRAMPGLTTLRPGDANEVVEAYRYIIQLRHQPAALALSRQPLPTLDRTMYASAAGLAHGAYVLADPPAGNPEVIIIASGSELSLAVDAHETLIGEGIRSRVVSMPSWEIFDHESKEYRDSVLPPAVTARVVVEQASTLGWERYVGTSGRVIGMHTFGASAPLKELQRKFGFEPGQVAAAAREQLRQT